MNERIEKLADECWSKSEYDPSIDPWFNHRKFAELIVRECVQTLRDNTPVLDENESLEDWNKGYIRAMLDCEHHITEHFGLE